jgi:putative ABC transport system ATP-binding protein
MTALDLAGVSKVRGRGPLAVSALRGVSLRIDPGELVLLEGPSGSGKTTLLSVAGGLLRPDAGEVRVGGELLPPGDAEARRTMRARRIGFVFQRSNLLPGLDALENVLVQAALAGVDEPLARRRAEELLDAMGVGHLAGRRVGGLSAGEEQRFAVARALVHSPPVVLADEPTASLDSAAGRAVVEALVALGRDRGAAILVATHDARLTPFATRRLRIVDGGVSPAGGVRGEP